LQMSATLGLLPLFLHWHVQEEIVAFAAESKRGQDLKACSATGMLRCLNPLRPTSRLERPTFCPLSGRPRTCSKQWKVQLYRIT
jgi:hypothetical protein